MYIYKSLSFPRTNIFTTISYTELSTCNIESIYVQLITCERPYKISLDKDKILKRQHIRWLEYLWRTHWSEVLLWEEATWRGGPIIWVWDSAWIVGVLRVGAWRVIVTRGQACKEVEVNLTWKLNQDLSTHPDRKVLVGLKGRQERTWKASCLASSKAWAEWGFLLKHKNM